MHVRAPCPSLLPWRHYQIAKTLFIKLKLYSLLTQFLNNATTLFVNFNSIASIYNMISAKKKIFNNFFLMKVNNNEEEKNNIKIIPIPGPSAVAAAVSISGFSEKFIFSVMLMKRVLWFKT